MLYLWNGNTIVGHCLRNENQLMQERKANALAIFEPTEEGTKPKIHTNEADCCRSATTNFVAINTSSQNRDLWQETVSEAKSTVVQQHQLTHDDDGGGT